MEMILVISTVGFHLLSAAVLILMVYTMRKDVKLNQGGGTHDGDRETPSQQAE